MSSNIEKMKEIQEKLNGLLVELQSLGVVTDGEDTETEEDCEYECFDSIVYGTDDRLDLLEILIEMGQEHADRTGENVFEVVLKYYPKFSSMLFDAE